MNQTANWWSIDVLNPGPGMGPCNAEKRNNREPSCDLAPGETGVLDLSDYASGPVEVHIYQPAFAGSPTVVTVNIPPSTP